MNSAQTLMLETLGISVTLAVVIGWIVWLVSRVQTLKIQSRHDLQQRFLESLTTKGSIDAFLGSASGRLFFDSLERADALASILSATGRGLLLLTLGLGFLVVRLVEPSFTYATVIGILLIAAGAGLLISAFVSRKVARSLGLTHREPPGEQ